MRAYMPTRILSRLQTLIASGITRTRLMLLQPVLVTNHTGQVYPMNNTLINEPISLATCTHPPIHAAIYQQNP